ncbi:MAG: AAA family ATPase [Candidatus Thiodiazotropha sp.]
MFESYYKLNANPFRLSADEQFRFAHKNYLKAWSHLKYALQQGEGFVMITGRPGSGKTTLIRDIVSEIDSSEILAINLVTNQLQAEELLRKVALEFGLPAESYNKATLLTHIEDFVTKEYNAGRRAVIVIDEAQNLTLNGLEELRLLSNLQSGSHPLFQIFLVGQDELRSLILSPGMEQIRQRLIASCKIELMNLEQTQGYIEHRLGIVGWDHDPELDEVIYPLIHYLTEGIPRKINHVVSRLLLYGALEAKHEFTEEDVWIVAKELFDEERLSIKSGETFTEFRENYDRGEGQAELPDDGEAASEVGDSAKAITGESVGQSEHREGLEGEEVDRNKLTAGAVDEDVGRHEHPQAALEVDAEQSEFAEMAEHEEAGQSELADVVEEEDAVRSEHGDVAEEADAGFDGPVSETVGEGLSGESEDHAEAVFTPDAEAEDEGYEETGLKDTEHAAEFFPYGEELVETDATVERTVTAEEQVGSDTAPTIPADAAEIRVDTESLEQLSGAVEKATVDASEIDVVTSQVHDVTAPVALKAAKTSGEGKPEEILNLPSMQAERRKHEIDEKGGLINTIETFEADELFTGTLGRSLRNIFLFVIAGAFFLALFVIQPESVQRAVDGLTAKWQKLSEPQTEADDPASIAVEKKQQIPEAPEHDSQQKKELVKSESDVSAIDAPQVTPESSLEPGTTGTTTASTDSGTGSEANIDGDRRMQSEMIDSIDDADAVERASKDYIATQSKYQKIEIGESAREAGPVVTAPIDMKFQIYFEFDNPNIPEQFKEMLNDLYIVLSLNDKSTVTITGYTDASGDPVYNKNLSIARANAVSRYFTERGITTERIRVEGRGPVPKTTNEEHEDFEKRFGNRRVEIVLSEGGE